MKEVIKHQQKLRCAWIYKQETLNFIIVAGGMSILRMYRLTYFVGH